MHEELENHAHEDDESHLIGKTRISIGNENLLTCNAQILDSYPLIFKEGFFNEPLFSFKGESQARFIAKIKEQFLYLSNIQLVIFRLNCGG